jgi:hypothetical protein
MQFYWKSLFESNNLEHPRVLVLVVVVIKFFIFIFFILEGSISQIDNILCSSTTAKQGQLQPSPKNN